MIARSAEKNCSIFNCGGKLELPTIIKNYLHYAIDYDNIFSNTKYCIQNMLRNIQETEQGKNFLESTTLEQIWYVLKEIWIFSVSSLPLRFLVLGMKVENI